MYRKITEAKLKSGETLEIGVVESPDREYSEKISELLSHKPEEFLWHIHRSVVEELDELDTFYYIGSIGDLPIVNIMTVESAGVGILGHVFTRPEHRRKGACSAVMSVQMDDFRRRNGRALYLGTGYDTPPYHIYRRFGFNSVFPGSGFMEYFAEADFKSKWFAPADVSIKTVEWQDWPKMTALTGITDGDWLRSRALGIAGPTNFEGGFLKLKIQLERKERFADFRLLESETGAVVGFASVCPAQESDGADNLLDLFVHPNFQTEATTLINAVEIPDGETVCYADETSSGKIAALQKLGFRQESVSKGELEKGDQKLDLIRFRLGD